MKRMSLPFRTFSFSPLAPCWWPSAFISLSFPTIFHRRRSAAPVHPYLGAYCPWSRLLLVAVINVLFLLVGFFLHQLRFWRPDGILHASLLPLYSGPGMDFPSLCPHY